jgi:enoyl-CoA hydratase
VSPTTDDELRIERRGAVVHVVLNRPRALNALTHDMCRRLLEGLADWQRDPELGAVVVEGEGDRAFCAGGDIRRVADMVTRDGAEAAAGFFRVEYPMNARLFHFTKPWIALLDGIVMGGGVGISIHGRHRIATDRTRFAMPETGIGFFPDVGGTWALPRLPGETGMFLGLTGQHLNAADCLASGIATAHVPSSSLDDLKESLFALATGPDFERRVGDVIGKLTMRPGAGSLASLRERIDACFRGDSLDEILHRLDVETSGFGQETLAVLRTKSPMSLKVTFEQLRRGRALPSFDEAMRLEYRLVRRFLAGHDFREGVRALIVDKDNTPAWRPATLAEVDPSEVAGYFAPLPESELGLP